ncbi:hypothetical protein L211DRAFT_835831, partial [Terfezia boudieri ATCC MYA-4762]
MAECSYIITLKDDATDADLQAVKDQVVASGGKIVHEYDLIKGFRRQNARGTRREFRQPPEGAGR